MELYTLNPGFFLNEKIDVFSSLIWTERYSSAGDVQLQVEPTRSMINALLPGTFLSLKGQREIMIIDTCTIANDILTVAGSSLVKFFSNRVAWFTNPNYDGSSGSSDTSLSAPYSDVATAGQFLADVVNMMVIESVDWESPYIPIRLDWDKENFPSLDLGHIDTLGGSKQLTFPLGSLYDGIEQIANAELLGFKLYLESATYSTGDHVLKFATYRGKNRTSDQDTNAMVRFAPDLDSLNDTTEVNTNVDYKNVAYVTYKNKVTEHYPSYITVPPTGFNRRVIRVDAPDIHIDPGDSRISDFRDRVAQNTFAAQRVSKTIDGTVTSRTGYIFGQDYYLGDLVELQGAAGIYRARVTEYIRSEDQYGEEGYPTFAALAQVSEFIEDPGFTPAWHDNPVFTGDPPASPDSGGDDGTDGVDRGGGDFSLVELTPWEAAGWFYDTDRGYYAEDGILYVCGSASAGINGTWNYPGSTTLLDNIPANLAPDSEQTVQVMIDPLNSSEHFSVGGWLSATVSPSGTVTLDDGNPAPTDGGSSGVENYAVISLLLSSISWPLGAGRVETTPSTESLDGHVAGGDAWSNSDGTFTARHTRFHLNGSISAGSDANDNAPMIIPGALCPAETSESSSEGFHWCGVCTTAGGAFYIGPRDIFGDHPLFVLGTVGGGGGGNNGNPSGTNSFYAKTSGGKGHGSETTLSFTPSAADAGVDYEGFSGSPGGPLPSSADWRGNYYSATVNFNISDIIHTAGSLGFPVDYSTITGPDQFAFIMAIDPTMNAYYKVVFTYDPVFDKLYIRLLVEVCGSSTQRAELGHQDISGSIRSGGDVSYSFTLEVSPNPDDVGFTGTLIPGSNYWRLGGIHGTDFSGSVPTPVHGGKGDMGVHIPDGCEVFSKSVGGIGDFPTFAEGDTVTLDGGGWPL